MKNIHYILLFIVSTCLWACGDADLNKPTGSTAIPGQVTVRKVVNGSGYSVIYYDRPDDINMKYLRAVYTPSGEVSREVNSSYYTDSVRLDGFAQAGEYDVKLYSVSAGEAVSEPVLAKVNPTIPPFQVAYSSLQITPTFGGVRVQFENPTKANLAIGVLKRSAEGWQEINVIYSQLEKGDYSVREQDSIPTIFAVYARDRWLHFSDTITAQLTPFPEYKCDKLKFEMMTLPGDCYVMHQWSGVTNYFYYLWDDKWAIFDPSFHTRPGVDPLPQHSGIDLGMEYYLSRLVFYPRASTGNTTMLYQAGMPKDMKFYGSNNPNPDGSWDSWTEIGEFTIKRPSGSDRPATEVALTDDDRAIITDGYEMEFPMDISTNYSFQYFRFETITTWGGATGIQIGEFTLYGNPKRK